MRVVSICLALLFSGSLLAQTLPGSAFISDVPGIEESMLGPGYWLEKNSEHELRMSPLQIEAFNSRGFALDSNLHDLEALPDVLGREQVLGLIQAVSRAASSPRYFAESGNQLTEADYANWDAATAQTAIGEQVAIGWGLVVKRSSMRSYPTDQRVLKTPGDYDLDRFQETALFPGERVAVLHRSADGQWLFVLNYHYAAWIKADAIALGSRERIDRWMSRQPRLVVTGSQVETNFNPVESRSSRLVLDMGVSLPLLEGSEAGFEVHGQNPYTSYAVELPLRTAQGTLEFSPALVARSRDVRKGFLPYTADNVIRQAFKFLGERYGWGHDYGGRDCTGFVGEVYKSFGLLMPRNTGQQASSPAIPGHNFEPGQRGEIRSALASLRVGDLIYVPGHVVMYLGEVEGKPYVIHDKTILEYTTDSGEVYTGILSGVSVTPLEPLRADADNEFIPSITAIRHIGAGANP